jgi:hypothetical protein
MLIFGLHHNALSSGHSPREPDVTLRQRLLTGGSPERAPVEPLLGSFHPREAAIMSTLQKNQHYVWRHYLLAWARGNQVWCVRAPATTAFSPNVSNIGSETFFYRVSELDEADLAYLEGIIARATTRELQDLNRGWIECFQRSFAIRRLLSGGDISEALRAQLAQALDEIDKTIAERYHGSVEGRAKPILERLRRGDAAFYEDLSGAIVFIEFLVHQYFRTARMRNLAGRLPQLVPHKPERTWPIESFIYATNVGASVVAQRKNYRITLLKNGTAVPFISSDQPVINLNSHEDEELCLYYPLSPKFALVYHADSERFPDARMSLSTLEVELYNFELYRRSDSQTYSNDRDYLEALVKLPKMQADWGDSLSAP